MKQTVLVDSHCHLDSLEKSDLIDNYLNRALAANVRYIQTICTRLDNFAHILGIARKYDNVFASVGVHPSEVTEVVSARQLLGLAADDKVIGFGETGLDYFYNKKPQQHKLQQQSFEQHLIAASEMKLPAIIHTREAEEDTEALIAAQKKVKDFPALIHCFTASKEFAFKMLDLGLYLSFSGIVTFKNASALQDTLKLVPLDRILLETDAPYLAPIPHRGKVNEPGFTKFVAEFVATIKGLSLQQVAQQTTDNFFTLFTKAKKL